jgi:hypothetical protein
MIPEPQKTYLLELLTALGSSAEDFVLAGAQSMKFSLGDARATRDFDFLLDAVHLREQASRVGETLGALGSYVVREAQNFQFEKQIPQSREVMRVEFMAPARTQAKERLPCGNRTGIACPRMLRRRHRIARIGRA